jgi:AAA domain
MEPYVDAAAFALDSPVEVPAVWGEGDQVLRAEGEPLMIAGPQGVGKTTVMQQLALTRHGAHDKPVLGLPVKMDPDRVLYLALDRPHQAARSMSRMVTEEDRFGLKWMHVWQGPLPFSVTRQPEALRDFVMGFEGVGSVFIDSLKDVAAGLSDDATGSAVNIAVQHVINSGVQVVAGHHQRKAQVGNPKPKSLSDVYGSVWLTAGMGSVVLLWGDPGDPVVELRHLKQPAAEVGPLTLIHDHERGETTVQEAVTAWELLRSAPAPGLTARDAAVGLYSTPEPSRSQVEKARRKLDAEVGKGKAKSIEGDRTTPTIYRLVSLRGES